MNKDKKFGKKMRAWGMVAAFAVSTFAAASPARGAGTYPSRGKGQWMEKLGLSPTQIPLMIKALGTRREALSPLFSRRKQILARLSEEVKTRATRGAVEETLKSFDAVKSRMREANKKFIDDENKILTPVQRARLIVERSERFEKLRAKEGQGVIH